MMHPSGGWDGRLVPTFLIMTPERVGSSARTFSFLVERVHNFTLSKDHSISSSWSLELAWTGGEVQPPPGILVPLFLSLTRESPR